MGYYLRALVAEEKLVRSLAKPYRYAVIVPLKQGIALLLNTDEFYDELQSANQWQREKPYSELWFLSAAIARLASNVSTTMPIAYIEADFFGGIGSQAAILWKNGQVVFGPVQVGNLRDMPTPPPLKDWPINSVLRLLGVVADEGKDEFETVGLRIHRNMEDWLESGNADQDE